MCGQVPQHNETDTKAYTMLGRPHLVLDGYATT